MAGQYEDLVELGIEGVDKLTDKYHDKVYGHLPAWKKQQQQQQQQDQREQRHQTRQDKHSQGPSERRGIHHDDSVVQDGQKPRSKEKERNMSYSPPQGSSYAQDRRQDYRDERDVRYVDERVYYKAPQAGTVAVARGSGPGEYGLVPPQAPSPMGYAVDTRREYSEYGRPVPSRQRSSSWSPPRNQRREDESRRRRRSRSRSRSRSRDTMSTRRIAATIIGGLAGGIAGSQVRKGQKYDTAATIGGAILGGVASREIADHIEKKRDDSRSKRDDEQGAWEQKYGHDDDGSDRRRSRDSRDYRDPRDARGWCDRCRCERSRCWCK